jgi:hypothetical protein
MKLLNRQTNKQTQINKRRNILIETNAVGPGNHPKYTAKIADLGLSRRFDGERKIT